MVESPAEANRSELPSQYGWARLLACYAAPGLIARCLAADHGRYTKRVLWADLALLAGNVVADWGVRDGLRRLPQEMGLWPPRQRRHSVASNLGFVSVSALVVTVGLTWSGTVLQSLSERRGGRFLNWTPIKTRPSSETATWTKRLVYDLPLASVAEDCYFRGLLWSRMEWLGSWRPLVNGAAWACYHLNRPVKDMLGAIMPAAVLASYVRSFTGNIYWTAVGHYLSNAYWTRYALKKQGQVVPVEGTVSLLR